MSTLTFDNIKKQINALEIYLGDESIDADVALQVITKLRDSFEWASSAQYTSEYLNDLVFSEKDALGVEGSDDLPDSMRDEVRDIQRDIINFFADDEQ